MGGDPRKTCYAGRVTAESAENLIYDFGDLRGPSVLGGGLETVVKEG